MKQQQVAVMLRMPKDLKVKIRTQAGAEDKSLNQKTIEVLAKAFEFDLDEDEPPFPKGRKRARQIAKSAGNFKTHEIVHHIDGNPMNNDPENLAVITRKQHRELHVAFGGLKPRKASKPNKWINKYTKGEI